jgi:translation initiation factor 4A
MADKGLEDVPEGQIESNYDETVDSFDDMNLKSELLRGGKFASPLRHTASL